MRKGKSRGDKRSVCFDLSSFDTADLNVLESLADMEVLSTLDFRMDGVNKVIKVCGAKDEIVAMEELLRTFKNKMEVEDSIWGEYVVSQTDMEKATNLAKKFERDMRKNGIYG